MKRNVLILCVVPVFWTGAFPLACGAEFKPAPHPFMLWTREESAAIRKRIETEGWAKAQYEALLKEKSECHAIRNIFRYVVMGDTSVVEAEKKYLLSLTGNDPRKFLGDTGGGRHYDQYLSVLRYDAFYDLLTEAERKGLEDTFRDFIKHHCQEETLRFTRTSWLPNMQWPRPMTAHLMAVALRDEQLIRECFNSRGGWKSYFDDYIADGQFYFEEFGKQYSMIGEMFLWCRGVERLGLDELGFGYTGKGGATMRRYVESMVSTGYPRVDLPGGMAHFPQITMGDARGSAFKDAPPYVFQKSIVTGHLANGNGGNTRWSASNMNGRDHKNAKVDKMLSPHWFELAHARWPDGKFEFFLAQMRKPGESAYIPSLYWGLQPIEARKVSPPAAPSYYARERGFVFLRAEESPAYWDSPAPAAAFQLATYYVHYAHDAFSLLGLYAFNRPIYLNRQISNGYGANCPWTDSTRGHCGVLVDNLYFQINDDDPKRDHAHWPNPIGEVPVRSAFTPLVKFAAAQARTVSGKVPLDSQQPLAWATLSLDLRKDEPEVWPGVEMSRALFLTREYLFDVYQLSSDRPRQFDWHVHALGLPKNGDGWSPNSDLTLERLYDMSNRAMIKQMSDPIERERYVPKDVLRLAPADKQWSATIIQNCALPDATQSLLGKLWYDREVGVSVHMLGEPDTLAYLGRSPESRKVAGKEGGKGDRAEIPNEVGGTTLLVSRRARNTSFVALHEPFENATPRVAAFKRIAQTDQGLAVAIDGAPGTEINDRICYRHWGAHDQPLTLAGDGESITFSDHAFIRIRAAMVEAVGGIKSLKLKVAGDVKLRLNGKDVSSNVKDGILIFSP